MIATWDGRSFEVAGDIGLQSTPWLFVKERGVPFSKEAFQALPPDGREWLIATVDFYVDTKQAKQAEALG